MCFSIPPFCAFLCTPTAYLLFATQLFLYPPQAKSQHEVLGGVGVATYRNSVVIFLIVKQLILDQAQQSEAKTTLGGTELSLAKVTTCSRSQMTWFYIRANIIHLSRYSVVFVLDIPIRNILYTIVKNEHSGTRGINLEVEVLARACSVPAVGVRAVDCWQ